MKSIQNTKNNTMIIIACVAALVLVAVGGYLLLVKPSNQAKQNQATKLQPATQSQINTGNATKQTTVEGGSKPDASHTDTPPQTNSSQIEVAFTSANQNGSILSVRGLISELISDGTCTLTLTQNSTVVTKTAATQTLANTSTCQGFDIPTSQLSPGSWHLTLTVSAPNRTGSATDDISIH